jgi:hypothetical protein
LNAITNNMAPSRLKGHLDACAASATRIRKSTADGVVLSPEDATKAIDELAGLVLTLTQAVTACANAAESASRDANRTRTPYRMPLW